LGAGWTLVDIAGEIDRKVSFCFETFCNKVADKNAARREMSEQLPGAMEVVKACAASLDMQKKLHGHDLMAVVGKTLRIDGYSQRWLSEPEELGRVLMASVEWDLVKDDETIKMIRTKFCSSQDGDSPAV
jgi:hypothetical protein